MKTEAPSRYALSFTSGNLLMREALIVAPIYLRENDWTKVRQLIDEGNLLQARTRSSGVRLALEVVKRLAVLNTDELELLVESTLTERGHILWAAACRRYTLIGEFAEEVLRERFLVLAPILDYDAFDSFLRGKALWHEEIAKLKDSTLQKLRSTLFRMMIEAGLLSENNRILQTLLSNRVSNALGSDIRFFPVGAIA